MKPALTWTLCGNFLVVDADDENAPLAELILHSPYREIAIDHPEEVAREILELMSQTPHPFRQETEGSD